MSTLVTEGLNAAYGRMQVLFDLNLQVGEGEIVTLIGANGAGKSSTLRTLSGLLKAKSGRILLKGQEIQGRKASEIVGMGMAHCPEGRQLWPQLTVEENLRMGAFTRTNSAEVREDIERMCELFPILQSRRQQVAESLSGGEQQALAIARALMSRPRFILFDEPSLGLAPMVIRTILQTIRSLRDTQGMSVLLVEQNARAALRIADRGYVLEKGRIVLEGTGEQLLHDPHVSKAYLGL